MQAEARLCTATRRDGSACTGRALPSSAEQRCFAHDSEQQEKLKASRSAGGKRRSTAARAQRYLPPHLATLQERLVELVDDVAEERLKPAQAMAIVATVGKLLDLARYAIEQREHEELEVRMAAIEAQIVTTRQGRRVGP